MAVGALFSVSMTVRTALTLVIVAMGAVLFPKQVAWLIETRPRLLNRTSKSLEALAGIVLVMVAAVAMSRWT
jgi:ABC-type nickel/cobalt efflux system permease component RcnA